MECFSQLVQGRDYLWWVGQFGILLEILGAVFIVIAAFKNRASVAKANGTWNGMAHISDLRDAIQGQAITELRGFVLLAIGLVLQLVGGLAT